MKKNYTIYSQKFKKNNKCIPLLFLIFLLGLSGYGQEFTVDAITYEITSVSPPEVAVTDNENGGRLRMPNTIDYDGTAYSVTSIGPDALRNNNLTEVIFPEGVTSIGADALRNNNLTEVTLPEGVISIGASAFALNELTSVTIPENVTSIGEEAFFAQFDQITEIIMLATAPPTLGVDAFENPELINVIVPSGSLTAYEDDDDWQGQGFKSIVDVFTTTWNDGNWSDGDPTIGKAVIIESDYDTGSLGSFSAFSLSVTESSTLTIGNEDYVEVETDVNVSLGSTLTIESSGALIQNSDDSNVTSDGTTQLIKTAFYYVYDDRIIWSSPVEDAELETVFPDTDNNGGSMEIGVGYPVGVRDAFTTSGTYDYTFEGTFNNGEIIKNYDDGEITVTGAAPGFLLLGNPYPSAINVEAFLAQNTYDVITNPEALLSGALYFQSDRGRNNVFSIVNGVGSVAGANGETPNGSIASAQGFYGLISDQRVSTTSNAVVYNNAMRSLDFSPDNTQFFDGSLSSGSTTTDDTTDNKLWLNFDQHEDNDGDGNYDDDDYEGDYADRERLLPIQILIGYVDGATDGEDSGYYDARKTSNPEFYSTIGNSTYLYAIQGKDPNSLNTDEIINLAFFAGTNPNEEYTISIDHLEGDFLENNSVYLRDNLLREVINLSENDGYTFESETGTFLNRFQIIFKDQLLSQELLFQGETVDDQFGRTVSLSRDGLTMAVAAPYYESALGQGGRVYVYRKDTDGEWSQIGDAFDGDNTNAPTGATSGRNSNNAELGSSLSLSSDGNILAIGTPQDHSTGINFAGKVSVYSYDSSTGEWDAMGSDLTGESVYYVPGHDTYDFGGSVSLSGDGTRLAIGNSRYDTDPLVNATNQVGLVSVYHFDDTDMDWELKTALGDDFVGDEQEELGDSVVLSEDGTILFAGAIAGGDLGYVRAYSYNSSTGEWAKMGEDIMDIEGTGGQSYFGSFLSLSNDGEVVAISAGYGYDKDGFVRVYRNNSGVFTQIGEDIINDNRTSSVISLSGDGEVLVIGDEAANHVRIYKNIGDAWIQLGDTIEGNTVGDGFGKSVSLSSDASILAVGAYLRNPGFSNFPLEEAGVVSVFENIDFDCSIEAFAQDITVQLDANGTVTISPEDVNNNSISDCGDPILTLDRTSFDCNDVGQTVEVVLTATSQDNLFSATATAMVTVENNNLVVIAKDITVQLDANGSVTIAPEDVDNGSVDICGSIDSFTLGLDRSVFTCADVGTPVQVTLIATQDNISSTATAMVTVENNNGGLVAIAQDITVQLDANGSVTIAPEDVDNGSGGGCDGGAVTLSLDRTTFTCTDAGETIAVTLTATQDTSSATTTAMVTVEKNSLVAIAKDITVQLDANGSVTIAPEDVDNGSGGVCGSIDSFTLGLDRSVFTCADVETPVQVTLIATQDNISATATAMVTVENNNGGLVAIAQDITVQLDANGSVTITPEDVDNGSGGGCDSTIPVTLSLDMTTFDCPELGNHIVTLTVTDMDGNEASETTTVTIEAMDTDNNRIADSCESLPLVTVTVPGGFSPNGDGIGDVLVIEDIQNFPDNRIEIFDLNQQLVYQSNNYQNDWDGMGNRNRKLPVGTYLCVVHFNVEESKPKARMIYINY